MPETENVEPEINWNLIIKRIHDGNCVPFLGAAANVTSSQYVGLPLGSEVSRKLAEEIKYKGKNSENLARVSLEYEFRNDRPCLNEDLKVIIPDTDREPSPLLRALSRLPFKLFITTNYDRLMEKALKEKGILFETLVQPTKGFDSGNNLLKNLEGYKEHLIYKIHGSFSDNGNSHCSDEMNIEKIDPIITEDDYIEFLAVEKDRNRISIPPFIIKKITPSTLLFLGYSLEDWDFRTIYKGIVERLNKNDQRKSFAIQKNADKFWVEFWERKGVVIYDVDIYWFGEELEKRYREKYPTDN